MYSNHVDIVLVIVLYKYPYLYGIDYKTNTLWPSEVSEYVYPLDW